MSSSDPSSSDELLDVISALAKRTSPETEAQIHLRREELDIQREQQKQAHIYAMAVLEAQRQDREDQRTADTRNGRLAVALVIIIVVALASFFFFALYRNKDALVLEVLKLVGAFLAGLFSGLGIKSAQNKAKPEEPKLTL